MYNQEMLESNKEWMDLLKKDLSCVIQEEGRKGAVYLSSLPTAQSLPLLQAHRITFVVSAAKGVRLSSVVPYLRSHLILPAEDCSDYDIGQFFDASFEFIESGRRQGGVLVHCMAGISRSAAILAAYLIKKQGISAQEAVKLLQEKRKQVCPNEGFMRQLSRYQKQQKKVLRGRTKTEGPSQIATEKMPFSTVFDPNLQKNMVVKEGFKEAGKQVERMAESSVVPKSEGRRDSVESSKGARGSRTLQKIQKMKKSMLVGLINEKFEGEKTFRKLLGNSIYRNKLKLR